MPRSVQFFEYGGPEVLRIVDLPIRDPGPDEVRLRVKAIGINRAETILVAGWHNYKPQLPSRLGWEASCEIDALGENVIGFSPGQAVSIIPVIITDLYGAYEEFITLPASYIVRNPAGLDHWQAAALWTSFLTAHGGLVEIAGLRRGDALLLTAASCSVGISAIQIARLLGAQIIATTRNPAKAAALQKAGADHVIVTTAENLAARVMEITGTGANIAFDPVGGPGVEAIAAAMAPFGKIIEYGLLSNEPTPFPLFPAIVKGLTMRGYSQDDMNRDPAWRARAIDFILHHTEAGHFRPLIDRIFPLSEVAEAHRYLLRSEQVGKVLLDPAG